MTDEVEGEEAICAVGKFGKEPLRAAADQVAATNDAGDLEEPLRFPILDDAKAQPTIFSREGCDRRIREADGNTVERRDDPHITGYPAGIAVRRALPRVVLRLMALFALVRADEILERSPRIRRRWSRRRESRPTADPRPSLDDPSHDDDRQHGNDRRRTQRPASSR